MKKVLFSIFLVAFAAPAMAEQKGNASLRAKMYTETYSEPCSFCGRTITAVVSDRSKWRAKSKAKKECLFKMQKHVMEECDG